MGRAHALPLGRVAGGGALLFSLGLTGCATTTTVRLDPPNAARVCQAQATARVWWTADWRLDQKDRAQREAAADAGIRAFFSESGCFASAQVVHAAGLHAALEQASNWLLATAAPPAEVNGAAAQAPVAAPAVALVLVVRELGPTLVVGSSPLLVEGATEVKLDARVLDASGAQRAHSVHWRNGGPGTVKGVATLPQDMATALSAGLRGTGP